MIHYTYRKETALAALIFSSTFVYAAPPQSTPFGARAMTAITSYDGSPGERWDGGGYSFGASSANMVSGQTTSGSSSSTASLANGTLGAFAASERRQNFSWITNRAIAYIWDTVTITSSGQNLGLIPLQFELDGSASGVGTASFSGTVYDLDNFTYVTESYQRNLTGDVKFDTTLDSELAPLIERHFMIGMGIGADATLNPGTWDNEATADFLHTLHFRWDLPEGVTFKSASGVFNPESITPVPEPATMAALGFGIFGLARARRRQN